ncbi:GGDEF domain-containing protein [Ureibacillus massiliensis]|uniref:GGDEF domain-containing protein n=1 Tax=Ureibacillus massiliensis TaxID=292806 RepID=UPI000689CA66|nr:GGDEF domain-containing protein [Ureibacillus massiliensis]
MNDILEEQRLVNLEITKHNLQKISLINKISTIVIVLLVIINTLLSNILFMNIDGNASINIEPYIVLILFNIVIFMITDIKKISVTTNNFRGIDTFISCYVVILTFFSSLITISDQQYYNQLMIYTLILFIACSVIILRANQLFIPLFVSSVTVLIGLYLQNGNTDLFKQQLVYLLLLDFIIFFISRSFYHSFRRSVVFQIKMLKEAHNTRELTKKLREANRKLELQANIDPLTKLFNRRAYNEYLEDLEKRANHHSFLFTAIMVDVDCFKLYNDTYGHTEGDNVLANIGEQLFQISDKYGCFASRWGGEEFTLLLVNHDDQLVNEICEEIIGQIKKLKINHSTSNINPFVTVSIGASTKKICDPNEIKSCVRKADEVLYHVKENGRNYYEHRQLYYI